MTDEREPIRFARYIDATRSIVLRGRHWYVQDEGQAERLWSLSEGSEDSMADEIESLRQQLAEVEAHRDDLKRKYEPEPRHCERDVPEGYLCGPCNYRYKQAGQVGEGSDE